MKLSSCVICLSILATSTFAHAANANRSPASFWGDMKRLFAKITEINPSLEPSPLPSPSNQPKSATNSAPSVGSARPTFPTMAPPPPPAPAANANACSAIGPQRIAVILASYPGAPADSSVPDANYIQSLFTGTDQGFSIADYYKTISGGKTWFSSVKVVGPYQSTPFVSAKDTVGHYYDGLDQWESHLLDLAAPDLDLMNTDRIVFITPEAIDSTGAPISYAAGMSTQGACDLKYSGSQGSRSFAHSYIFASPALHGIDVNRMFSPDVFNGMSDDEKQARIKQATTQQMALDMRAITHELGHTFGLGHANTVQRPTQGFTNSPGTYDDEILPAASTHMHVEEYGDPFDVMASSDFRWLNVPQLDQLGWIDHDTQLQTVTSNGSFRIYPLDQSPNDLTKLRGIKIPRAIQSPTENTDSFLWVEFRSGSAPYDLDATGLNLNTDGALVHYTDPEQLQADPSNPYSTPNESILLNFAPQGSLISPFQKDYTLKGAWKDPYSMVRLQVIQVTSDFIDVQVSFEQ